MTWLDDLAEASWRAFWHKHGRLKPGEVPPPYPGAQRTGKNTLFRKIKQTMTHPLNDAITIATFSGTFPEIRKNHPQRDRFYLSILIRRLGDTACGIPTTDALAGIATGTNDWLLDLGISDPWQAMCDDYEQQKMAWNGPKNLDHSGLSDKTRYLRMIAQLGKIAYTLDDDQVVTADTVAPEITRLGAYALAWLAHEIRKETEK